MYDKESYMHGNCQYFALAAHDLFGGKIHLWLDEWYDEEEDCVRTVLCHAYLEIAPKLYLDANGLFRDIEEREEEFEYCEQEIVSFSTVAKAKEFLQRLAVPITDTATKREVREYLRNTMLVMELQHNGAMYPLGLCGKVHRNGIQGLMFYSYAPDLGTFNKMVHSFAVQEVSTKYVREIGFVNNSRWYYKV